MYDIVEGHAPFRDFETWYRVCGELGSGMTPLVVAHGGPGCTHDYVDAFRDIAETGRAVIHYDQLGNGRSTHLRDKPADFWKPALFLDELASLLKHLGIADNYALLGQSWGGMLGAEHAVTTPPGLQALIIANSPASMGLWLQAAARLRNELPEDVQATLLAHEAAGTLASDDYKAASQVFYKRHVCRLDPWPDEVRRTFDAMDADPTVYHAMNGPTEFHVIGSLKDWSVIDRLRRAGAADLGPARRSGAGGRAAFRGPHRGRRMGDLRALQPHAARGGEGRVHEGGHGLPEEEARRLDRRARCRPSSSSHPRD